MGRKKENLRLGRGIKADPDLGPTPIAAQLPHSVPSFLHLPDAQLLVEAQEITEVGKQVGLRTQRVETVEKTDPGELQLDN